MVQRVRIKMCGMTRREDVLHAARLGADAIGLIFHPASPRCVTLEQAAELLGKQPLFTNVVAVLVNPEVQQVNEIIHALPVNWLQFHGDETPEFCRQFDLPYIKAVPVRSSSCINDAMRKYAEASALLLETPSLAVRGGSGQVFDWRLIPEQRTLPIILAGGLSLENIAEALKVCQPDAVDICSGLESSPGIKDHDKMNRFVELVGGINEQ
ncbi:N-(5'-phosphoribosyl)anthranilate isomerase [Legionella birminghamensis]|uniref:N-(5'-phosphoribosyl)anthranilate isomerase n=2 Tax=Legionella birminghamensis TaxID=28083 RepID=A0A378I843_9GAMM|nr:N-(5'-phosphoribosyl)anthranilate isomerase [Legionella birminghamensis]STX31387.1 phosphoribosyl anthranilate isomerase [Legionella birminghamensis]